MVLLQIPLKLRVGGLLLEVLQHLEDLLLHGQGRSELVHEQLLRRLDARHSTPFGLMLGVPKGYPAPDRANTLRALFAGKT